MMQYNFPAGQYTVVLTDVIEVINKISYNASTHKYLIPLTVHSVHTRVTNS